MTDSPLGGLLARLLPFAALSSGQRAEMARLCTRESVSRARGEMKLTDWPGQALYLISGEIRLKFADGSIEVRVGGSEPARHYLGAGGRQPVSFKAITDIELLRLDEEILDLILAWYQSSDAIAMAKERQETTDWRMMSGIFAAQNLARSAFAPLPAANIANLLERFERIIVKRGDVIVRQDDSGDYYYLIERGRCMVTRRVGGAELEVAVLKPGDAFGEEALLADASRNATVTMKTNGVLLRLAKQDFFKLLREPLLVQIDWAEAQHRVRGGAQWIDVRFPAEFSYDGLPGAINIPLNEVRRSAVLLNAGREYVAYCQSGRRSSAAAFLLSQRGLCASVLKGGLRARPQTSPEAVIQ